MGENLETPLVTLFERAHGRVPDNAEEIADWLLSPEGDEILARYRKGPVWIACAAVEQNEPKP